MIRAPRVLAVVALAALLPAGCGGTATPPAPTAQSSPSLSSASPAATASPPSLPSDRNRTAVPEGSPAPGKGKAAAGKAGPLTAGPIPGSAYTVVRAGTLLVAGTEERGALVSSDDGAHWRPMNDGLPDAPSMLSIVVEPRGGRLLALVSGGVYSAAPRLPLAWRRWGAPLPGSSNPETLGYWPPTGLVLVGDGSGALYAASGATASWRAADSGLPVGRAAITSLILAGGILYAGLTSGLAASKDGATWHIEAGLADHSVDAMSVLPNGGLAAALDRDGVAIRGGVGAAWQVFSDDALGLPAGERVLSLAYDAATRHLYIGTLASGVRVLGGLALPARRVEGVPLEDPVNGMLVSGHTLFAAANGGIVSLDTGKSRPA